MGWAGQTWRTETARALHRPLVDVLGDKTAKALLPLGLETVDDLMHHLPRHYLTGTQTTDLGGIQAGQFVAVVAMTSGVVARFDSRGRPRVECQLTDGVNQIGATFFCRPNLVDYWQRTLTSGVKGIFVGKVGQFNKALQMTHPDFVMLDANGDIVARASEKRTAMVKQVTRSGLIGIYPATAKMPTWQVAECADIALQTLQGLPDSLPDQVVHDEGLPSLVAALEAIHRPVDMDLVVTALQRLKFEEALALLLTMAYRRASRGNQQAPSIEPHGDGLLAAFDKRLPFNLTQGQREVAAEITADMAKQLPMQRLLQGEVGSGKTVVALRAMLAAVDAGYQGVLLAPTEVLAQQHTATISTLLGDLATGGTLGAPALATRLVTLTGSMSAIARRNTMDSLASGEPAIIVGTHALLHQRTRLTNLGVLVIDEQHRFGVEQRAMLTDQTSSADGQASWRPHVLVMTATPIPRSVAMTVFGDLEVSTLTQLPAGRADVATTVVDVVAHPAWLDRAWQRCREEVAAGRQVFVVAPRINARDEDIADPAVATTPSASAVELAQQLSGDVLADLRVGLLHGQLPAADKTDVMTRFAAGQIDVLVCTTVIEVGVDVPNASMMVIMDADRFGVAQLHQLRGRIGRGDQPGVCLLITSTAAESKAAERLATVAATRDGFQLAEYDLIARREGDVLGAQQAGGRSTLRLLRALDDADLIVHARQVAEQLVAGDPQCVDPRLADLVAGVEHQSDWLDRS